MPVYKFTQFFKHGRQGWTESWYYTSSSFTFDQAMTLGTKLSTERRKLLGGGPQLQGTRVEDVTPATTPFPGALPPGPNPGEILYNLDGGYSLAADPISVCQAPEDCALIDVYAGGSLYRKSVEFHGIPGDAYTAWGFSKNLQTLTPVYSIRISQFFSFMSIPLGNSFGGGPSAWSLRGRVGRGVPDFGQLIEGVATESATDFHIVINVGDDDSWNIGDRIHLHGLKGCWAKGLNGDATVINTAVVGAEVFLTLNKLQCCHAVIDYDGTARYWPVEYNYAGMDGGTVARYSWRKVGRPTFGTRGRARKRVCCKG